MRSRDVCWLVMAVCGLSTSLLGRPALAQEPPTLEQIIEGLQRREKLFFQSESLLIRYERTKSEKVPSATIGEFLLAEWTLAYRGDKWFTERRFTHPEHTKDIFTPAEPMTQVLKKQFLVEWTQHANVAVVDRFKLGRNFYGGLYYTRNLSLDAPKYIAKSNGADLNEIRNTEYLRDDVAHPFLPEFLRENKAQYQVLPEPEEVDGVPCWVVEWPRGWIGFASIPSAALRSLGAPTAGGRANR